MADDAELKALIVRSLNDLQFRMLLITNPVEAAGELGYTLNIQQIAACKGADTPSGSRILEKRISKQVLIPALGSDAGN
jgi:hypothetical protein